MKKIRKIMVLLLIVAVCITPSKKGTKVMIAKAITTNTVNNSDLKAPTTDANGVTSWDSVYFGSYWQSDTNKDGKANDKDEKLRYSGGCCLLIMTKYYYWQTNV